MKNYSYLIGFLIASFFFMSCDSTDEANEILEDLEDTILFEDMYFSLFVGDTWRYNVSVDAMPATQDTLTVLNDQNAPIGFAKLEASPTSTGFMTGLLGNGFIQELDNKLVYQGFLDLPVDPDNPIQIDVAEAIVYDLQMPSGSTLSVIEQTITQDLNGIPITIDVVATTIQRNIITNYTVSGQTFEKAVQSSLVVTATISAEILGFPVTLLNTQEVFVAENTFGLNVGLVASTATLDYEFVDLSPFGITLPFSPSATSVSIQEIDSYVVTLNDN
ncbi:MAG: CheY-like chemotaxis protein [Flavobacteriales bacterium]|jgi:CheY-like chemotaxis protein